MPQKLIPAAALFTLAAVAVACSAPVPPQPAATSFAMQTWDTNQDGHLSLNEAHAAAAAHFTALDTNHDGELQRNELGSAVTDDEFVAADTDHDGALNQQEYYTIVDHRFAGTDPDSDGVLLTELNSPVGQRLVQLLE